MSTPTLLSFLFILFQGQPEPVNSNVFTDPRDGNTYQYVQVGELDWFVENLRFQTTNSVDVSGEELNECGLFYPVEEAGTVCPDSWRLPTEKEVKALIKNEKRGRIQLIDTLQIQLCGRIDYGTLAKTGTQNTFWIDAKLEDGYITHWHTFGTKNELHRHNVTVAQRKFPVRCVRPHTMPSN
ncbi:MAG: FISUMP domain-containing protein [Saprospiraceae bacterium]